MTGLKITVPTTISRSFSEKLYRDGLMNSGSLWLADLAHPTNPLASGVPASGSSIPNIASEAATVLAGGTDTTLAGTFTTNFDGATEALWERSGNGGLHGMLSLTNQSTNQAGEIRLPSLIETYLYNNRSNALYFSMWIRLTRNGVAGSLQPPFSSLAKSYSATSAMAFYIYQNGFTLSGTNLGTSADPGLTTLGNTFLSLGNAGWGADPGSGNVKGAMAGWGNYSSWSGLNASPSYIFYRSYLEDLTVSAAAAGKTTAQMYSDRLAKDKALWAAAFASGGRYNGDTFTTPAI